MKNVVKSIIEGIDRGMFFDSHFVIDTVIRDHSDAYLVFAAEKTAKAKVTEYVHSEIAKTISSFDNDLVERVEGHSWSFNVRGRASGCALWKKV